MALKKSVSELVAAAEARIERLTPEQARQLLEDPDVRFVDIRDVRELKREGTVPGALHAPRGMLEFWVDPDSPYHKADFAAASASSCSAPSATAPPSPPPSSWIWGLGRSAISKEALKRGVARAGRSRGRVNS